MSTLIELVTKGELVRFDAELGPHVLEIRRLFMLPRAIEQIEARISGTVSDRQIETAPDEQLDNLLAEFCEGVEMKMTTQFHTVRPIDCGAWELKTADVRVFGWFYAKDCFIASAVDAAWHVKRHRLYSGYAQEAEAHRKRLFGQNAPYVEGMDPDDVLSNWY
ncbi:hypothetical protein [Sphingobium sp. YR657]|uniref:hypothetical protein n=1 Tax=Sphingobium sp. YR657 TaxID=1884366 RepID=UPI0009322B09|nr:hypothetical protein [Sphingobium sp. YR657]